MQQIAASADAFAALLGDGSVVTWGNAGSGGDSSAVQDQLKNVNVIHGSDEAFAALLEDGCVVTWGDAGTGGDSSSVQHQLKNVQEIPSSGTALAAILEDGSVVTWGDADSGGDSSAVQRRLKNVQDLDLKEAVPQLLFAPQQGPRLLIRFTAFSWSSRRSRPSVGNNLESCWLCW